MFAAVVRVRPSPTRPFRCTPHHIRRLKQTDVKQTNSEGTVPEDAITKKFSEDEDKVVLKPLSRPLGVLQKPSEKPKTWKDKKEEMLNYEKVLEKRKHLVKEASKAYFQDYHALKHHEGKTWIAPKSLIREDKAAYFPDITGVSLTPQDTVHTTTLLRGYASIISVLSSTRSEEHAKSFTELSLEAYRSNPLFRFVQINLQENPLKGFLVSLFLSSIRSRVPPDLQSTYLVSRQNMEYVREPMGMINKHVGYVYLVDENCKIRWAGCGFALEGEDQSLKNCTRVLLQRLASEAETRSKESKDGVTSTASTEDAT